MGSNNKDTREHTRKGQTAKERRQLRSRRRRYQFPDGDYRNVIREEWDALLLPIVEALAPEIMDVVGTPLARSSLDRLIEQKSIRFYGRFKRYAGMAFCHTDTTLINPWSSDHSTRAGLIRTIKHELLHIALPMGTGHGMLFRAKWAELDPLPIEHESHGSIYTVTHKPHFRPKRIYWCPDCGQDTLLGPGRLILGRTARRHKTCPKCKGERLEFLALTKGPNKWFSILPTLGDTRHEGTPFDGAILNTWLETGMVNEEELRIHNQTVEGYQKWARDRGIREEMPIYWDDLHKALRSRCVEVKNPGRLAYLYKSDKED